MNERRIWLIRGGSGGEAHELFLEHDLIALGWPEVGNLRGIEPDRHAFFTRVAATYPDRGSGWHRNGSGQLYRYVHEMQVDDIVIYPSKVDGQYHIGRVTGGYFHDTALNGEFPNRRPSAWLGAVPREQFSPTARAEMGSIMTLFQVKRHAQEVWDVVARLRA